MTTDNQPPRNGSDRQPDSRTDGSAAWTDGLKQLYDSVVEEPLPDAFMDLLAQFDEDDGGQGGASDSGKSAG